MFPQYLLSLTLHFSWSLTFVIFEGYLYKIIYFITFIQLPGLLGQGLGLRLGPGLDNLPDGVKEGVWTDVKEDEGIEDEDIVPYRNHMVFQNVSYCL